MMSFRALLFLLSITLALSAGCGNLTQSADIQSFDTKENTFNRNPDRIIFTKHGRCRMHCRSIDSLEVDEILKKGDINYAKSNITSTNPCRKKYALEGKTRDNQQVRIIFSPCKDNQTVVTVIDMDTDWACDCK
ncbi:DUF4258 domain-containing protein [Pedobacter nyackensis]|uniref:DUF4258 domain-containing protein n=1 Tax=Pedobacter nyackensis TaxID=475255 RepID=A0A1W2ANL2_9SPHI|nr:DUF4258 domain-containing protein [Pedobacter nyackensis]SMC61818.1 protein of unknown function [Pedobacter nyackensis]